MSNKISKIESKSFLKSWKYHNNEEFVLSDGQKIIQSDAMDDFLLTFIEHYDAHKTNAVNYIKGCDNAFGFKIHLPNDCSEKYIKYVCKDIWNHPQEYWGYTRECEEDDYYKFLKYLWVKWNGKEYRLGDIACDKKY